MSPAPWTNSPEPLILEDDYTVAPRPHPVSHPPIDAPLCLTCRQLDLSFFDPSCPGCSEILKSRETSIGQILAVMRQWVPQTQHNIDQLVLEVLKRGAHPDDRDSLTDMTLLMYSCKAGASGVGNVEAAVKITTYLVERGCDMQARCRWTDMAALHYSTYFDVAPVLTILLHHTKGADVDTHCVEYENGTALHIAASNLSLGAARVLLKFGADIEATDDLGRKPVECIPDAANFELVPDAQELIEKMAKLLLEGLEDRNRSPSTLMKTSTKSISGRTVLQAMGLKVNDRVVVGNKLGTLRFCGTTEFATGIWAGVELDTPEGKNDGTVKGMRYFRCDKNHGIFISANKISKAGKGYKAVSSEPKRVPIKPVVNHGRVDISHVQAKFHTAMAVIAERSEVRVGDRVFVKEVTPDKGCKGTVRFLGSVDFVDDMSEWLGIELDQQMGRHDGTVQGVRYFAAGKDRGVFVTLNKVVKLDSDENYNESCDVSLCESSLSMMSPAPPSQTRSYSATPTTLVRRSLSLRHHENKSTTPSMTGSMNSKVPSNFSRSYSVRGRSDSNERNVPKFQTSTVTHYNKFKKKLDKKYLEVGQGVMCIHNREMAVVKYIGHTDFAPGIWVGLEIKNPKGKHNGIVKERRYFTCKEGHGVMVKPRTLSVHGINGQELVRPESFYPI
eukprot:TRINITY_DN7180_c0_g1_i2.p1 TRINITY_DN7180_c0_g1~~TRINITY_DN7180_c0_g1_i2.p1  ORF type:complete len:672 (+),score=124.75 TRINITY_DN7180_c0_g1_i2:72-2087(+)